MKNKLYKNFIKDGRVDLQILEIFETFFDQNLDIMCILDHDGNFLRINNSFKENLGYSLDDLEDKKIMNFIHTDDKTNINCLIQNVKKDNKKFKVELRYKSSKGEYRNLECKVHDLYNMYYISARDVTDWEQTKILLNESKETIKRSLKLQEKVSDVALKFILTKDFNKQIIDSVSDICLFLGIDGFFFFLDEKDKDESVLKYYWKDPCSIHSKVDEDNITHQSISSYKYLLEKNGIIFSKDLAELPEQLKNHLFKNHVISVMILPIYINNVINGFVRFDCVKDTNKCDESIVQSLQTLVRIISSAYEKRVIELRLKESLKSLDTFFDNSKDGFIFMTLKSPLIWNDSSDKNLLLDYVFDNEKVTKANDTLLKQHGVTREEFLTYTPKDFYKHDLEAGRRIWRKLFDTGFFHLDTEFVNANGKTIVIQGDYVCLYDEEGRITGHFGVQRDITKDREAQLKIKESEMRFKELAENIEDIFWIRENDKVVYVNSSFERITGMPITKLQQEGYKPFFDIVLDEDKVIFQQNMIQDTSNFNSRYRIRRADGEIRWLWDRGRTYFCPFTDVVRSVSVSSDITVMKNLEEQLKFTASVDGLTQIYNRKYVFEKLEKIIEDYRQNNTEFSFSIIDIDFFKNINDSFGHPAGDFILKEFAKLIGKNIRSTDLLGRYGGEEFVIVLKNTDKVQAQKIVTNILKIVREKAFIYEDSKIFFTFSCGISDSNDFERNEITINHIVNCADERLYTAKNTGRNNIVIK